MDEVVGGNPWKSLSPGGVDARRVDPDGRHDFFWVISGKAEPGLLLRLPAGLEEPGQLPRMRNLELSFRDLAGGRSLVLILKDAEQKELFETLCLDIARSAEAAADGSEALQRAIRRTLRWHHLLRGGQNVRLNPEEQRGLVGELNFLRRLVDLLGPHAAIEAWKGPSGSAKDFELGSCLVEVKARRGAARPFVQISSEDQLADVEGARLFLVVCAVDAVIRPNGMTLTDHVLEIEKAYALTSPEAYQLWEQAITDTGFDFDHDYSDRRWLVGKSTEYEVLRGFPRIATPLQSGVSGVRYSISLDACSPFTAAAGLLDALISEGGSDGRSE